MNEFEDHSHDVTLRSTNGMLNHDWEVPISHIYRENNHIPDHLVRGHVLSVRFHYIELKKSYFVLLIVL
ncbi:hypothetical protein LINPERPRIM_LOCUS2963 [Linum perenne]